MIIKDRTIPIQIQKLEAMKRRILNLHPKRSLIGEELAKRRAGYHGEQSLDYHLSFLPKKQYHILHNLRLFNQNLYYFELDTLILTPFFICIIEVKNISGTITFDDHFHQLIRTIDGKEEAFQDPLTQLKRHQFQFTNWLKENKFPAVPIKTLVVISNPSTVIHVSDDPKNYQMITHSIHLMFEIEKFSKMYKKEVLSQKDLSRLSKLLLKKHTPVNYDPLKLFKINKSEIEKGVHCPSCFKLVMKRIHGKWVCPTCQFSSKTAHIPSLKDYALLISPTITNRELRDFLKIPTKTMATNILQSMDLPYTGEGIARKYQLP